MGLSDAKLVDAQAGLESGMGAVIAALSGVNVISGPGMLNFESCQSLEKLVLDNEICGMALRLVRGVEARSQQLGGDLYGDIYNGEHFMGSMETVQWFRKEMYIPGDVVDRETYDVWCESGKMSAWERAKDEVNRILKIHQYRPLPEEVSGELRSIMEKDAVSQGMNSLPPTD
jgi:trimethylamine--corrinoid protein Co-methyltransferase